MDRRLELINMFLSWVIQVGGFVILVASLVILSNKDHAAIHTSIITCIVVVVCFFIGLTWALLSKEVHPNQPLGPPIPSTPNQPHGPPIPSTPNQPDGPPPSSFLNQPHGSPLFFSPNQQPEHWRPVTTPRSLSGARTRPLSDGRIRTYAGERGEGSESVDGENRTLVRRRKLRPGFHLIDEVPLEKVSGKKVPLEKVSGKKVPLKDSNGIDAAKDP